MKLEIVTTKPASIVSLCVSTVTRMTSGDDGA